MGLHRRRPQPRPRPSSPAASPQAVAGPDGADGLAGAAQPGQVRTPGTGHGMVRSTVPSWLMTATWVPSIRRACAGAMAALCAARCRCWQCRRVGAAALSEGQLPKQAGVSVR